MFIKHSLVLLILALCGIYLAVSKAEDKQCEQDWKYYNGNCYIYVKNLTSWRKSQEACVSKQANLVTINDQEEQNFLSTLMKSKGAWMGLHYNSDKKVFEWISGKQSNFTYWNTNEPVISAKKRCVHMYQTHNHTWHTQGCGNRQRFICEKGWEPCDSKPCQNGGTCEPDGDNYTCQCMAGLTGHQCEQGIKATSTAVNVVISTSRPMEVPSTTKAAISTPEIPEVTQSFPEIAEVTQSSNVSPKQSHSVAITPSTSTEPATSSPLEGPKVVPPTYPKPEMTTAYTRPEMTTSPPKIDPTSTPGEGGETGARKQPKSNGINVAAIVVPLVLILLLILLVVIGCFCYGRKKEEREKANGTADMTPGDLALLQPPNDANNSRTENQPPDQSEGSLEKSLDSDEDSIINYSEGGSFIGEYDDGKKVAPQVV